MVQRCDSRFLEGSLVMRFDLSDEEWAVIEPLLPKAGRGPKRVDDRRVLNGIFYIRPVAKVRISPMVSSPA